MLRLCIRILAVFDEGETRAESSSYPKRLRTGRRRTISVWLLVKLFITFPVGRAAPGACCQLPKCLSVLSGSYLLFSGLVTIVYFTLKLFQLSHFHMRKGYRSQLVEMFVVGDYVFCIGNYGTIHKLVVILVCCYKVESVLGINTQDIRCPEYHFYS